MSEKGSDSASPATTTTNPKKKTDNPPINEAPGKKNKRSRQHQRRNKNGAGNPSGAAPARRPLSEKKLSHSLSWALRHAALDIGLTIKEDGYVPVQEILDSTHSKLRGATLETIQIVVKNCDKKRFKLAERPLRLYYPKGERDIDPSNEKKILCIRANQGHSISVINPESLLNKLSPNELRSIPCIVHGTHPQAWESIRNERTGGLKKMNRTHIHFAIGLPADDGVISGMRKSSSVHIYIDASRCAADDRIDFYMSDNGVVLTDGIASSGVLPIDYFSYVTDSSGKILLDNRENDVKRE